jgi:magnesium-transporting ATPase (P-type)
LTAEVFNRIQSIKEIATVCTLNNKSGIVYEDDKFNKQGEPTEAALKVAAEKLGQFDNKFNKVDYTKIPTGYGNYLGQTITTIATLDFTSERKTMSTVVKGFENNANTLLLKGAPERVIEKSKTYKKEDGSIADFTEAEKKKLIDQI